jgi:NADPH:quinone reductase-like Zn-dependent oxidoreductase
MLPTMGTYRERYIEVKEGGDVFIQEASGGVGISLSEIVKLKKLNMFGTASKEMHGFLKETGVIPINYQEDDFVKTIKSKYPKGIDAAFDARCGIDLRNVSKVVKKGGTVVTYAFSGKGFGGNKEMIKGLCVLQSFPYLKGSNPRI